MKKLHTLPLFTLQIFLLLMTTACTSTPTEPAGDYSRGLGVYPGDPQQDFAPVAVPGGDRYRNLALLRAARASSSIDYNLTAQLVTDGLTTTDEPILLTVLVDGVEVEKRRREVLFDGNHTTGLKAQDHLEIELQMQNEELEADAVDVRLVCSPRSGTATLEVEAFDGDQWIAQGSLTQSFRQTNPFGYNWFHVPLTGGMAYQQYRVRASVPHAEQLTVTNLDFRLRGELQSILPAERFTSLWRSETAGEEWISVDLGAEATFDRLVTHWLNAPASGMVQTSSDGLQWTDLCTLTDQHELHVKGSGRYVRLLLDHSASDQPYELSELEIWGRGGIAYVPHDAPGRNALGETLLNGGEWRMQRADLVTLTGEELSLPGIDELSAEGQTSAAGTRTSDAGTQSSAAVTQTWPLATVPATILTSYQNIGAIPDPNFAADQLQLSESFFRSDFWYRREFDYHPSAGQHTHLCFDGINWKAEVYLNGTQVGRIEGAFHRGDFDVTSLLREGRNALAVHVIRNSHFGVVKEQNAEDVDVNGGELGADNPTFHASIGWDWIPTIRGREVGIWNDVRLRDVGPVQLRDPFVQTTLPLPDTTSADISIALTLINQEAAPIEGRLVGSYGEAQFEWPVTLAAGEVRSLTLTPADCPQLHLEHPRLWWPNGYGEPHLYDVELAFLCRDTISDRCSFSSGVRQMTWREEAYRHAPDYVYGPYEKRGEQPRRLELYVNGRRFVGFGGNWGFPESNLRYREREYDAALAYHRDQNFTMVRNWVGQTGDEEFYDACDCYGIMIWQDFWLANPWDGPDPADDAMFEQNALDYVRRIRNHPSLALYCGRNEGNPPQQIDDYLRQMLSTEHPGLPYISHSASGVVSGGGPYNLLPTEQYFTASGCDKMHSERGIPCVMNYEDMVRAFGIDHMLPVNTVDNPNDMYGLHDYAMTCAMRGATYNERFESNFGTMAEVTRDGTAERFAELAQWMNYDGYRAAFEGRADHREGLLLWMSHPAWPSMVWQTYDYYLEPTAAYFACRKACEPLHILYNPVRNRVVVVNYRAGAQQGLEAVSEVYSMEGRLLGTQSQQLDIADDQTLDLFDVTVPAEADDVYYLRLSLRQGERLVSENFYVRSRETDCLRALWSLPQTQLKSDLNFMCLDDAGQRSVRWCGMLRLRNDSSVPALMLRVKVVGSESQDLLTPVFYSDNYFTLLPGEERTIQLSFLDFDTRGETPEVVVTGFNVR